MFDIIIRNAKRLGGLSEKILDFQKIENRTLMLDKERFNINEMVRNIINEIKLKGTGSGLGLFISKGIVEAHGGKVWAENNAEGKGATFSFTLPISQD
jgi:signal transduction histidine kinase